MTLAKGHSKGRRSISSQIKISKTDVGAGGEEEETSVNKSNKNKKKLNSLPYAFKAIFCSHSQFPEVPLKRTRKVQNRTHCIPCTTI